ncbi:hypothetical protein DICA3_B12002 [Diutina catenulata]
MKGDEGLLPPLPAEPVSVVSTSDIGSVDSITPDPEELFPVLASNESFVDYHLDSPNLVDHQYFVKAQASPPMPKPSRLKSLKHNIRKLSLSTKTKDTKGDDASVSVTSIPVTSIPKSSKAASLASADSGHSKASSARGPQTPSVEQSVSSPRHSPHSSTSSMSNILRTRACSVATPLTPPLTSPVITLSENLSQSKKSMSSIEQSYFDQREANSVADLATADELLEFSAFLTMQKQSMTTAFAATKAKMTQSGWCTESDLDNIQLQEDSSLCQIDSKLIQIEHRLNREFGISSMA